MAAVGLRLELLGCLGLFEAIRGSMGALERLRVLTVHESY